MSTDGKRTKWHRKIAENSNLVSRMTDTPDRQTARQTDDRRQTDGRRHVR